MNTVILQNFGLTKNEIAIYEALLKLGRSKTGPITKNSGIVSSRVYEALNNLIKKGLVSFLVRNNIRYYQTEPPEQLLDDLDKSKQDLIQLTKEIKKMSILKTERNTINTFEGKHGFNMAFTKHVELCKPSDELLIISFSPRLSDFKTLRNFFKKLDNQIISQKLKVRMLLDKNLKKSFGKDKQKIKNYTLKYMPPGYFNPSAINISPTQVMFSVWGQNPTVFTIQNPVVNQSFRQHFEYLWQKAK